MNETVLPDASEAIAEIIAQNPSVENIHVIKHCPFRICTGFRGIELEYYQQVQHNGKWRAIPMRLVVGKIDPKTSEYVNPLGKAVYDLCTDFEHCLGVIAARDAEIKELKAELASKRKAK